MCPHSSRASQCSSDTTPSRQMEQSGIVPEGYWNRAGGRKPAASDKAAAEGLAGGRGGSLGGSLGGRGREVRMRVGSEGLAGFIYWSQWSKREREAEGGTRAKVIKSKREGVFTLLHR